MRTCHDCGETKDESEYYHRDGKLMKICRDCWKRRYVKPKQQEAGKEKS